VIDRPKIKVFPAQGEEGTDYYWHLVNRKGEIQAQGEGYTRREDAVRGVYEMAETLLLIIGAAAVPTQDQVKQALYEGIEIIEEDGSVLTLEEAGYQPVLQMSHAEAKGMEDA
jgi:uncharacterized protein YegP (UPF0339 family)